MKELLNIEPFGIILNYDEGAKYPYIVEISDLAGPAWQEFRSGTREEAMGTIINYILNPDNVYAMEDQPWDLREAYRLAGVRDGVAAGLHLGAHSEITDSVGTFLYYVLDGIACTNLYNEQ